MTKDGSDIMIGILAALSLVALVGTAIWAFITAPLPVIAFLIALGLCYAVSDKLKETP